MSTVGANPRVRPVARASSARSPILPILILLLAFFLRAASLTLDRFHADEALYSGWALRIRDGDPFLLDVPVDKPPLYLFALAASFRTFGSSELAARLPNLAAGMLNLALLYALARRLYGPRTARWATFVLACSPYSILFARTAFTDTTLVTWTLAALYAATGGRWLWAGIAMGLALATKQHAVILYPLVFAVGWMALTYSACGGSYPEGIPVGQSTAGPGKAKRWRVFLSLLGFAPILALVTWWDAQRWEIRPGYWQQSTLSYGGLAWAAPAEWGGRLLEWLGWARYLFGSPLLYATFGLGIVLLMLWNWGLLPARGGSYQRVSCGQSTASSDRAAHPPDCPQNTLRYGPARAQNKILDTLLAAYLLAYILLHTVAGFSVWDRYLLPLAPLVALLVGRMVSIVIPECSYRESRNPVTPALRAGASVPGISSRESRITRIVLPLTLSLLLLLSGTRAARNGYPVGGDHWAYQGLDEIASYLKTNAPPDAVLYHHWLRWHYTYYLHGTPFELRYWESGEHLLRESRRSPDHAQYIVLPTWRTEDPAIEGLSFEPLLSPQRRDGSVALTLYRVVVDP